jgi:hypothetical protein
VRKQFVHILGPTVEKAKPKAQFPTLADVSIALTIGRSKSCEKWSLTQNIIGLDA